MMPSSAAEAPDVSAIAARLRSGDTFVALVAEQTEERAAALKSILRDIAGDETRVVWVGNPLRSPLTIERFLLQVIGPEVDLRIERSPAELAQLLAGKAMAETRMIVIVQQPETINPETEEILGAMASHLAGHPVQLQFLFVGSPGLRLPRRPPPFLRERPRPALWPSEIPDEPPTRRRWDMAPVALLLFVATVGVALPSWPTTTGTRSKPAIVRLDLAPFPAPLPNAMMGESSDLRATFDDVLTDNATALPPLTASQKNALFDEFVARYREQ